MSTKEAQFLYLAFQGGGSTFPPVSCATGCNSFRWPGLRTFRFISHSIVASQSDGNLAFTVHAVCSCACFQSSDESYSMLPQQQLQNQFSAEVHMSNQKTGL